MVMMPRACISIALFFQGLQMTSRNEAVLVALSPPALKGVNMNLAED